MEKEKIVGKFLTHTCTPLPQCWRQAEDLVLSDEPDANLRRGQGRDRRQVSSHPPGPKFSDKLYRYGTGNQYICIGFEKSILVDKSSLSDSSFPYDSGSDQVWSRRRRQFLLLIPVLGTVLRSRPFMSRTGCGSTKKVKNRKRRKI